MKTRLALFAAAVLAGMGSAGTDQPGPTDRAQAGEQQTDAQDKGRPIPAQPTPQPAKTDRERIVGNWFITNDDSQRRGEMWVVTEDSILMHAKDGGAIAHHYAHRLDESKNPKQIDITVSLIKGPTVGVIKGIYILDGDELRLCLGEMGKDRPAAFPEKPKLGELLVLRRASSGATPPAANDAGPPTPKDAAPPASDNAQPEQKKVLTPEEAIQQRPKEKVVTVQFKVTAVQDESQSPGTGFGVGFILLKDGGSFSARLVPPAMYTIMRLDIEPVKHFTGKVVRVTGLVQPVLQIRQAEGPCWIDVTDLEHFAVLRQ